MASDTRQWTCPECGKKVELSIFKLDPMACDDCLAKRNSKSAESAATGPLKLLPDFSKFGGLVAGVLLGLIVGFVAGRWTAPSVDANRGEAPPGRSASSSASHSSDEHAGTEADEAPDESTRPGPNYKWVKGYTRKDGVHVKGHWARDSRKPGE